jgi:hypothetical protein
MALVTERHRRDSGAPVSYMAITSHWMRHMVRAVAAILAGLLLVFGTAYTTVATAESSDSLSNAAATLGTVVATGSLQRDGSCLMLLAKPVELDPRNGQQTWVSLALTV